MLQSLHVKNIALIDDVEIDFTNGLNILTGETGAGKSILIDSVGFALGERVHKEIIRDDDKSALAELVFSVDDKNILDKLDEMDIPVENGEVILSRRINGSKSVCKINGESLPASVVKEVASLLIDVHGQHEHQSLLYKKNHKILLDSFCGDDFQQKLCKLKETYDEYIKIKKEYEMAVETENQSVKDLDYSEFVVNEIMAASLKEGEDEQLESEFSRMNNSRRIAENLSGVMSAMSSDSEGAGSCISYAVSLMKLIAGIDSNARDMYDELVQIEDLIADVTRSLHSYEDTLEFSPEEYAHVEERIDQINRLKMKYGNSIADILARCEEESEKIEKLKNYDNYLEELKFKMDDKYDILCKVCAQISEIRSKEAGVLQQEIIVALNNLNFLDAQFEICVRADADKISQDGWDDVEFMISTNPGEELKPLTMVASGGELSRIMLALKSVLAKRDNIGTLIFDEIDTGISGKTAQRVADRMSEIAACHQVICITHLPQIASHATTHFLIEKSVDNARTYTDVTSLSYDASVEELARMLAGESITDAVRQNASEMKKAAMLVV